MTWSMLCSQETGITGHFEVKRAGAVLNNNNEGVVSKETVVLRRWGSSIQKFGQLRAESPALTP